VGRKRVWVSKKSGKVGQTNVRTTGRESGGREDWAAIAIEHPYKCSQLSVSHLCASQSKLPKNIAFMGHDKVDNLSRLGQVATVFGFSPKMPRKCSNVTVPYITGINAPRSIIHWTWLTEANASHGRKRVRHYLNFYLS